MDAGTDNTTDKGTDGDEGRWLTYGELAALRRIDRHSAVKLVTRHRWRRQRDNRGVLRILVPLGWAGGTDKGTDKGTNNTTDRGIDKGTDRGTDIAAFEAALDAIREAHAGEAAALLERAAAAEQRAEASDKGRMAMQALADRLSAQLADAGARADRLERDLAAAIDRAQQALAQASTLQATIDELRAGQTLMAETHARDLAAVIQRAQDAAEETIRQRVERLEHDRATSVAIADEAMRAAEHLRQAAAEGKGRGRWARLRAAWRRE